MFRSPAPALTSAEPVRASAHAGWRVVERCGSLRRTLATTIALVALLASLTACSDGDDATAPTTGPPTTEPTTGPPTTKSPTTAPTNAPTTAAPPTTVAPTTVPAAPRTAEFPGPSNTGVPSGTRLRPSGTVKVTQEGAVIDGLDITGTLEIWADDVTVRRTRVRSDGAKNWVVAWIEAGRTGVVIEDCEIDGLGAAGWPEGGAIGIQGEGVTIRRCDIHHVGDGMKSGSNVVFEDNWVHDLEAAGEPHYDGFQFDGGGENITIRHNTISIPDQTGAVNLGNTFGPVANVVVDGNLLSGGTYTVYVDGQFTSEPFTRISVTNNRFGWHTYGHALVRDTTLDASHGNVDAETGTPITFN
jgi:Right handed beta helix region